jgi:hypothetical protein
MNQCTFGGREFGRFVYGITERNEMIVSASNDQTIAKRRLVMHIFRTTLRVGFLGMMLIGLPLDGMSADRGRGACRGGDRLRIQDLDLSPDPVIEGQRIRLWKVRIRLDGNRECETEISIREGNDLVGQERHYNLRPGINEIEIQPVESYRFRGREHCFDVIVDLEGTRRRVDSDRRFCAYQKPAWSMREAGDREGFRR